MSRLEKLLNKYCPNGVKHLQTGEVFDVITDYTAAGSFADIAKNVEYLNEPDYALLVRTTDLKSGFSKGKFIYINKHAYDYLWRVHLDSASLILPNIGNCGEVYYLSPDTIPYEKCALAPNAILVRSSTCNMRYLFHVLQTKEYLNQLAKITSPSGQTKFNKTDFKHIKIPIPPLEIQDEIACILDNFSELTIKLTVELSARKKQYEYYRKKLINDCEGEIKTLDELCFVYTGGEAPSNVTAEPDENNIYAIWANGREVYGYTDTYKIESDAVCISSIGANTGAVFFHEGKFTPIIRLKVLVPRRDNVDIRYLYHAVSLIDFTGRKISSVPNMNASEVKSKTIKIPSLADQRRIAQLLDKFDSLTTDKTIGLPAEIEARQKQYEYYRELLFSFKELDV